MHFTQEQEDIAMIKKLTTLTPTLTFLFLAFFVSAVSFAQDSDKEAAEIIKKWRKNYEESIQQVEDFIIVKESNTICYKKAFDDNGRPYFKTRVESEGKGGLNSTSTVSESDILSEEVYASAKEKAIYEGSEQINGQKVHVLYIDKLESVIDGSQIEGPIEDIRLYVDPEDWVVRQMHYTVEFTDEEGKVREVDPLIRNRDFRNKKGMMIPYETKTTVTGLQMTEEERQEAEKSLKEVEAKLEDMPEQQRKMVEQMMSDKLEQAKQALEDDQVEMVKRVKEVKVNTGMEDF